MEYSNDATKEGIVQECDFWATSDATSYPIAQKTRNANNALNKVISLILGADGRWQYDDTNRTDLPIGTTDLVANQQDYGISTDMLLITRVEIKDSNGKWQLLTPMDQNDLNNPSFNQNSSKVPGGYYSGGLSLTDFLETPGIPLYYDNIANSLFLYPKPNYNSTGGLKVYYQRVPSYFTTSDTTKKPGFAPHLNRYISLSMAYDYAFAKGLDKQASLKQEMFSFEQAIKDFYEYKPKYEQVILKPHMENYS